MATPYITSRVPSRKKIIHLQKFFTKVKNLLLLANCTLIIRVRIVMSDPNIFWNRQIAAAMAVSQNDSS